MRKGKIGLLVFFFSPNTKWLVSCYQQPQDHLHHDTHRLYTHSVSSVKLIPVSFGHTQRISKGSSEHWTLLYWVSLSPFLFLTHTLSLSLSRPLFLCMWARYSFYPQNQHLKWNIHFWKCQLHVIDQCSNGTDQSLFYWPEKRSQLPWLWITELISEKTEWNKKVLFSTQESKKGRLFFFFFSKSFLSTDHNQTYWN